jgi:hypothetical protein
MGVENCRGIDNTKKKISFFLSIPRSSFIASNIDLSIPFVNKNEIFFSSFSHSPTNLAFLDKISF